MKTCIVFSVEIANWPIFYTDDLGKYNIGLFEINDIAIYCHGPWMTCLDYHSVQLFSTLIEEAKNKIVFLEKKKEYIYIYIFINMYIYILYI